MFYSPSTHLVLLTLFASRSQAIYPNNEIYYLTNCFDDLFGRSYATVDYYANKSLSAIAGNPTQPDLVSWVNTSSSVNYEDGTWKTLSPSEFNFTAVIGKNAYTASVGTIVGSAQSNQTVGPLACSRLKRTMVHFQKELSCYADYSCTSVLR